MAEWSVAPGSRRGPTHYWLALGDYDHLYEKATGRFVGMQRRGGRFIPARPLLRECRRVRWPAQQWQRV